MPAASLVAFQHGDSLSAYLCSGNNASVGLVYVPKDQFVSYSTRQTGNITRGGRWGALTRASVELWKLPGSYAQHANSENYTLYC